MAKTNTGTVVKELHDQTQEVLGKIKPKTIGGKIAKAAGTSLFEGIVPATVRALADATTNHPEWYTHLPESSLVNMNLATKQNVTFYNLEQAGRNFTDEQGEQTYLNSIKLPAVATMQVLLTVPKGDDDGWKIGIRRLYQQLRTANSGKMNYSVSDIEKYILNARVLYAICAYLKRLYKATYTFVSTNADIPYAYLRAMSVDPDSMMSNASNLFTYTQRYIQQVRMSFPVNCDLITRTMWLFSNVFKDSSKCKPQYYVPTLNQSTSGFTDNFAGCYYFTSANNGSKLTWTVHHAYNTDQIYQQDLSYEDLTTVFDEIKNALIEDDGCSTIAGDMIKAFGDRAFVQMEAPKIDDQVIPVFDEHVLSQLQNANVLYVDAVTHDSAQREHHDIYRFSSAQTDTWLDTTLRLASADDWSQGSHGRSVGQIKADRYNNGLVNWYKETITPGEVMSITRFYCTDATAVSNNETDYYWEFGTYGTEVITGVFVTAFIRNINDTTGTYTSTAKWIPIAGTVIQEFGDETPNGVGGVDSDASAGIWMQYSAVTCWAMFDWAPKLSLAGSNETGSGTSATKGVYYFSPDMLDWDVYAQVDKDHIRTYFSYGNQSLLYAGASQNQSNTRVYAKTGKSKGHKYKK